MHAVIFDIDGTLINSASIDDALYREAVRRVLGEVQLRPSLHAYDYVTDTGILYQIVADNEIPVEQATCLIHYGHPRRMRSRSPQAAGARVQNLNSGRPAWIIRMSHSLHRTITTSEHLSWNSRWPGWVITLTV